MLDEKMYKRLRSEIETAFTKATESATRQRDKEIAALEVLWSSLGPVKHAEPSAPNGNPNPVVNSAHDAQPSDSLYTGSSLVQAVRDATMVLRGSFTREEVLSWLAENRRELNPISRKVSIATALSRMVGKEITTAEKGSGRKPSKYKRITGFDEG